MAAGANDYFTKVGSPGNATYLTAPGHTIAGTTFTVDSTSLMPTDTAIIFGVDTTSIVNGEVTRDVGSYTVWRGTVASSTTITNATLMWGTDQNYSAGSTTRVYVLPTSSRENRIVDGLVLAGLNQTGSMTPKVLTSINDINGNEVIKTPATSSAVNEITVTNAATGVAPSISATGGDSAINLNLRGKGSAKTVTIGAGATTIYPFDFVSSGCVWSGDSYGASLAGSMTAGVVVINGNPVTVAAVTAHAFTASKDTYVDVLDAGDGTGTVVYTEANNNAASAALASNSIRIGIIVTAAGSIAAATSVNQGQETMILPIASSIPYAVTDSLGNLICNRNSKPGVIGLRRKISNQGSVTTVVDVTGLSFTCTVPTGGARIKLSARSQIESSVAADVARLSIKEGATVLSWADSCADTANKGQTVSTFYSGFVAAGTHTYKLTIERASGTGNVLLSADSAGNQTYLMAEIN